jgi:hypothetical protein
MRGVTTFAAADLIVAAPPDVLATRALIKVDCEIRSDFQGL